MEDDVDIWRYTILKLHARNDGDNDDTPVASLDLINVVTLC